MKLKLFFIILIISILSISPVSANILLSDTPSFSGNNIFSDTSGGSGGLIGGSDFSGGIKGVNVDFNDGKEIKSIYTTGGITLARFTGVTPGQYLTASANGINELYTPFTATVSGQYYGSGVIGWVRLTGADFKYVITFNSRDDVYANSITGVKSLDLTYNSSVYNGYIYSQSYEGGTEGGAYNYVHIYSSYYTTTFSRVDKAAIATTVYINYEFQDHPTITVENVSTTNAYVNLSKVGVNYELRINNNTGYPFYDITSTANVNYFVDYTNSLKIYIYHVGIGIWSNYTVIYNPTAGAGTITTDKSNYIIGEKPIITWVINSPNPSYYYYLIGTNSINNTHTISSNIATSGSATDPVAFDVSGTWKESIIALNNSCTGPTYYCWIAGDILNTYVSISSTQPALSANITANKSTYEYHERWNFTVKATGTNQYIIKAYDPNGQLFAGFPSPAVSGNQTLLYTPSAYTLGGTWTAKVYDIVNAQYVAQTTFIINPTQGGYYVGQIHILEGSIDLNVQEYFTVAYTSNGTGTITIKKPDGSTYITYSSINGSGQDIITLSSSADIGYWGAVLVDRANIYQAQVYVTKGGATTSQNGSFTIFTDKTAYLRGDIVQATYRFPANFNNISVVVYDANGQKMASALRPAPEAQLFGYASITIGQSGANGNWKITLEDLNRTEYASATFSVRGITPTVPPGSGSTANAAANLFNLFSYMAFYGLVIFLGIFFSTIKLMSAHGAQVNGHALVIIMTLVATMEALIGLFDPFKIYIIVISWIFAAIYFRQTRTTATGE